MLYHYVKTTLLKIYYKNFIYCKILNLFTQKVLAKFNCKQHQ